MRYEPRTYRATVRVYYETFFGRDRLADASINYEVTKNLNGHLQFQQNGTNSSMSNNVLKSTEDTELSINFHDPSRKS